MLPVSALFLLELLHSAGNLLSRAHENNAVSFETDSPAKGDLTLGQSVGLAN